MMTDLEGVAGVVSFTDQAYADAPYLERARSLLTAEVNSAVEGLLEAGAEDVVVMDGHGAGAVVFEEMHEKASLIHGRPLPPTWIDEVAGNDAVIFVGQHAMAGVASGNMNHTQNSRGITHIKINDRLIGEFGQFTLLAGTCGVPAIFLSGDEAACREAEELVPEIVTVSVKRGIGRTAAVTLSGPEAQRRIREGVIRALEKHRKTPVEPLRMTGPYVLEKRYFSTDLPEKYKNRSDVTFIDPLTVQITGENLRDIIYA
jgi:D-amino peptidase